MARDAFRHRCRLCPKGGLDIVTEVDHATEALICDLIQAAFPADAILAEERGRSGRHPGTAGSWTPWTARITTPPRFPSGASPSPAITRNQPPRNRRDLRSAARGAVRRHAGRGATLNSGRSRRPRPRFAPGGAGLRHRLQPGDLAPHDANRPGSAAAQPPPADHGSAVLALAYVAAGRIDTSSTSICSPGIWPRPGCCSRRPEA